MTDFETLMEEHGRIAILALRLEMALGDGDYDRGAALAALDALSVELVAHLAHEDAGIYPLLISGKDAAAAGIASAVAAEYRSLAEDWSDFLGRWDASALAEDPSGFRQTALSLLERLRERILRENELLYPVALAAAHIALRKPRRAG